jgi:hypothetical protein
MALSSNMKFLSIFLGIHLHTHEYTWARPCREVHGVANAKVVGMWERAHARLSPTDAIEKRASAPSFI